MATSNQPERRQTVPKSKFARRGFQASAVIGDYLYIEGGEFAEKGDSTTRLLKTTLSLPLKKSWTASEVKIRSIPKHRAPTLDKPTIWVDEKTSSYYQWGGYVAPLDRQFARINELWKFTPDGFGGGKWSLEDVSPVERTECGPATVGNGVGYTVGGVPSKFGNQYPLSDQDDPTSGMVSYDFSKRQWAKHSSENYSKSGTGAWGESVFVPNFGPEGLVIAMGGGAKDEKTGDIEWFNFNNLKIYDPKSKQWYTQQTSGQAPSPRYRFCIVGTESKHGTFEIFLYGGFNQIVNHALADSYVLTLPGFHWQKGPSTRDQRALHSCNIVGKSQMIIIGGVNQALPFPDMFVSDPDTHPQGLYLFDMIKMRYGESYNADADPYDSPQVIQNWYKQANSSSVAWTSPEVRDFFVNKNSKLYPSSPHQLPAHGSPSNNSQNSSQSDSSSSISTGAIAGIVVGSVALLCLLAVVLIFLFRRRLRHKKPLPPPVELEAPRLQEKALPPIPPPELDSTQPQLYELPVKS